MKQLLIWGAVFLGLYGGMSGAYHLYLTHHPRRVLVALDTSFPMHTVWSQVPATLAALQTQRYTLFSLITDKSKTFVRAYGFLASVLPFAGHMRYT